MEIIKSLARVSVSCILFWHKASMIKKVLFILLFLLIFPSIAFVQTNEVEVQGKILDQNNNPIPGAIVIINDQIGEIIEEVRSDARGFYKAVVPQGSYSITALGPEGTEFISTTFNNKEIFSQEEINFRLLSALPDQSSATSNTNIVFYALNAAVVLGIGGFGAILYLKYLRRRKSH